MSEDIVIDCKSLVEWLESRRKLEKDWVNKLKGVQLKYKEIIEAVKQKPYEDIKSWVKEREKEFNYLDMLELFEKLKQTPEAEAKTLFGYYSSPLMKEISSLIKVIEKGNLHLAEIAKQLSQWSNFEGPSLQKSKQISESDIKQFESKKSILMNSISRLKSEESDFLAKNDLQQGAIDQSISNRVHTIPDKIDQLVKMLRDTEIKKFLTHYYKLTEYLSSSNEQDCKMKHIEFLIEYGDLPLNYFENYMTGKTSNIKTEAFDYTRFFNKQGFYKASSTVDQPASDAKQWAIEEVHDLTSSIDQWQIVEEEPAETENKSPEASVKVSDRSALLSQEFRDALSAEIEELVYFYQERQSQAGTSNSMLMFDRDLASLFNSMTIEEMQKAVDRLSKLQTMFHEAQFRQNLSFLDNEKAKERVLNNLENIVGARKRKERQTWKLNENIQELKSGISETKDLLLNLNRQITKFSSKMEEHMSKNIKRKVIVTKTAF